MRKLSRRQTKNLEKTKNIISTNVQEAISLLKETATTKFVESVELHANLNIDPKYANQQLRTSLVLPNGTGKNLRIAVFTEADYVDEVLKMGATIADSSIQFALNFKYQTNIIIDGLGKSTDSSPVMKIFPPAPAIDSETGHCVLFEEEDICSESSESSIYLMQNLRVGDSDCLTIFDP